MKGSTFLSTPTSLGSDYHSVNYNCKLLCILLQATFGTQVWMGGKLEACCAVSLPEMVAEKQHDIVLAFKGNTEEWDISQQQ